MKKILSILRLEGGDDPDPRFSLANERTFLAWNRTALGFLLTAIATASLNHDFWSKQTQHYLFLCLIALAIFISCFAILRWFHVEYSLRIKKIVPYSIFLPLLSTALCGMVLFILLQTVG